MQLVRCFFGFFSQSFNALASFCELVSGSSLVVFPTRMSGDCAPGVDEDDEFPDPAGWSLLLVFELAGWPAPDRSDVVVLSG